jgi:hypothetical protein
MFAKFDYSLYDSQSIVKVMLYNEINELHFNSFIEEWKSLYKLKNNFIFIFNTKKIGILPLYYSIQMSQFISKLKKEPKQYLQKSIIIVNSNIVKYMLNIIFTYQTPVAPVYLIELNDNTNDIIDKIVNNENELINKTNITTILPSK